ncbi:MAG: hypothetical protein ACYDGR_17070, partial [Candidatus Dormibacteria bacterium]
SQAGLRSGTSLDLGYAWSAGGSPGASASGQFVLVLRCSATPVGGGAASLTSVELPFRVS